MSRNQTKLRRFAARTAFTRGTALSGISPGVHCSIVSAIPPLMARDYAREMFSDLLARLSVDQRHRDTLFGMWTEPWRHYHTAGHAGVLWHRHLAYGGDPSDRVIAHAIAYHDAVYSVGATDNEARSAALWYEHSANLGRSLREKVANVIMATSRHVGDHPDRDAQWMVDLDLTPLGEPWPLFEANSLALRAEAPDLPIEKFRANQRMFLSAVMSLPTLYRSNRHRQILCRTYENTARENLRRLLVR